MQAAQLLAGYTLGGADLLRRAMGKKIKEEIDRCKAGEAQCQTCNCTNQPLGGGGNECPYYDKCCHEQKNEPRITRNNFV